jgi:hypothetical protein
MKFTKSSLLSSLAAAGMVLGAVAPVVANAAGFDYTTKPQNTLTVTESGDVKVTSASPVPGYLSSKTDKNGNPIYNYGQGYVANSGSANTNSSADFAQGISEALVKITAGYLTLDAVPDFNFGTVSAGAKPSIQNFSGVISDDGNDQGLLQITDSRSTTVTPAVEVAPADTTAALTKAGVSAGGATVISKAIAGKNITDATTLIKNETDSAVVGDDIANAIKALPAIFTPSNASNDGMGYNLQVALGQFSKLSENNARTDATVSGFSLFLPDLRTTSGVVTTTQSGNTFKFNGAVDGINEQGASGASAVQVASADDKGSFGTAKVNFNSKPGIDGTSLQVPDQIDAGSYDAPVYWILNANVGGDANTR